MKPGRFLLLLDSSLLQWFIFAALLLWKQQCSREQICFTNVHFVTWNIYIFSILLYNNIVRFIKSLRMSPTNSCFLVNEQLRKTWLMRINRHEKEHICIKWSMKSRWKIGFGIWALGPHIHITFFLFFTLFL